MGNTYSTKKSRRKLIVTSALGAVLVIPTAAWAAVELFGFGEFEADAAASQTLVIDGAKLSKPLVPGATVGAEGIVHNPNDFPVTVTSVIIRAEGLGATGKGCNPKTVTPEGDFVEVGGAVGDGWETKLEKPVIVPEKGSAPISIAKAVTQAKSATAMCGVKANLAVRAQVGD